MRPNGDGSKPFTVTISKPRHCSGCDTEIATGQQVECHCKRCTWWRHSGCKQWNKGRVK